MDVIELLILSKEYALEFSKLSLEFIYVIINVCIKEVLVLLLSLHVYKLQFNFTL